jgi:undecaprenyl-diphosphatase
MSADEAAAAAWAQALGSQAVPWFAAALALLLVVTALAWMGLRRVVLPVQASSLPPLLFLALRLLVGFAVVLSAGALFAEMAEALDSGEEMGRFDSQLAQTLSSSLSPATLRFFGTVTHLGDVATLTVLVIAVALLLVLRGRRWLALGWAAACAGNGVLNQSLKRLFERVRPVHEHGYALADGFSFPSGHTSGSVVVYGMLAYLAMRLLPARWHLPSVLAAAALAFTIGCSRVFLQVHWASDVLAGFASGSAWLVVCVVSVEMLRHYRRKPA